MAKSQVAYVCSRCGGVSLKWQGQCVACGEWNTLEATAATAEMPVGRARRGTAGVVRLAELRTTPAGRHPTGLGELDRVLGGGLVAGSVVLVGGPPGIGKSTLLLQVAAAGADEAGTLYASGEESAEQIALRVQRLGLAAEAISMIATTDVDEVIESAQAMRCRCLIVDSIQTMMAGSVPSVPGSPNQLRECAGRLVQFAKATGTAVVLVGHVTKEGLIAGPRLLEHMVDVVLYFEDEAGSRYRLLRSVKNRFGAANELGIFAMGETGLREVRNPSAIFLSRPVAETPGSVVTVLHQGTRPLLVEVQALTDSGGNGPARRLAIGADPNRLAMLLAVLHRHAGISVHEDDVFVNVVGGIRVAETAADLALLLAVVSSRLSRPVARQTVVFGEVGLGGEIRPVAYGEERIREAAKLGFGHAIVAPANVPRRPIGGIEVVGVASVSEALRRQSGSGSG